MTEVHEDLRDDTRHPSQKRSNQALFKSLYQDMKDAPTKLWKEWIVKRKMEIDRVPVKCFV